MRNLTLAEVLAIDAWHAANDGDEGFDSSEAFGGIGKVSYEAQNLLSDAIGFVWQTKSGIYAESSDQFLNIYTVGNTVQSAAELFCAEYLKKIAYEKQFSEDKLFQLEERLKRHDWTFMFSDDNRYFVSGNANLNAINRLIEEVGQQTGTELWNKYCPSDMIIN